jgi:hypothetical protein
MSADTITATVKLLNGELLQITHDPIHSFQHFTQQIYTACPTIPAHTLKLILIHRVEPDPEDEVAWLMRLGELDTKEGYTNVVYEGDLFMALVDDSHITHYVTRKNNITIASRVPLHLETSLNRYTIHFVVPAKDGNVSINASSTDILHDEEARQFALTLSFTPPRYARACCWKANETLVWYDTLREALLASPDIPKSEFQLDEVQASFDNNDIGDEREIFYREYNSDEEDFEIARYWIRRGR